MLETDFTWWAYGAWIVIAIFTVVALGVLVVTKRILFAAIVFVLGLGAGGLIKGLSGDSYFDIAIIKEADGVIAAEINRDEVGGIYTFSNSDSVVLRRGENEEGSFIINDSNQYAFVSLVHYIAAGVADSSVPADEVLVVVGPGQSKYVTYSFDYASSVDDEPPVEIDIGENASYETRYWLTWADFEPALGPY